jgi:hypothetical protein
MIVKKNNETNAYCKNQTPVTEVFSGGNLGGAGGGVPPPPSRKIDEFSEILT